MSRPFSFTLLVPVLVAGCPNEDLAGRYQAAVDARIGISATNGEAPLHVVVSAAESTSARGAIVKYAWDFAGQARSEQMTAEHTFTSPGRFPITLTVVDASGEQASARIYVRVRGGEVIAVISADPLSGPAPLLVHFDGSASRAVGDTILDYFWDFDDNQQSRQSAPIHRYESPGTYTVTLRVVSAGGVEATAEATVTVGSSAAASLQFDGGQFANLPVAPVSVLDAFTFEAWCNPNSDGGTLVNFGVPGIGIDVWPTAAAIAVRAGGESRSAAVALEPGRWQHVAVSYSSEAGATVYLAGAPVATLPMTGEFSLTVLSLGAGFRGRIAEVRFWSTERTGAEVAADVAGDLSGFEEGLLGDWPLSAGSGQTLQNKADSGENGTLGASAGPEAADPAWSTDGP